MGLADLKKNSTQSNAARDNAARSAQLSLDDFIDEASLYALGLTHKAGHENVVDICDHLKQSRSSNVRVISKGNAPYRKATFTLSEGAISHLTELANDCDVAKSRLIRFLIEHHYSLPVEQRKRKEQSLLVE